MTNRFSILKPILALPVCLLMLCASHAAQAQGSDLQLNIDGVTAWNDYVPGGHQMPPTGGGTGSNVGLGTQLSASVTLGTSYSPTTINCYANGTQIYHLITSLSSGEWNFNWTPSAVGTYTVYCNEDQVTTPNIYVPVVPSYQGYIDPKYVVLGVTYAPPGPQSSVTYTDSQGLATTTSLSQSASSGTSYSVNLTVTGKILGWKGGTTFRLHQLVHSNNEG